jgi:hypothetical protein
MLVIVTVVVDLVIDVVAAVLEIKVVFVATGADDVDMDVGAGWEG